MSGRIAFAAIARRDGSEADGIHLLWTAPPETGYSIDGWDLERRASAGRPKVQCHVLTVAELETLQDVLRLSTPLGDFAMRIGPSPDGGTCRIYEITLAEGHRYVRVTAGVAEMLAIALRGGKAVAARTGPVAGGSQSVTFENLDVDQVVLSCPSEAKSLELCLDIAPTAAQEAEMWQGATMIAKGLQVPIRALDPTLASHPAEEAHARSRLLPGETLDPGQFEAVSRLMNEAAADAQNAPPISASAMLRDDLGDPFIDVRAWSYALALSIEPAWRRMLGFGLLDPAKGLELGHSYDYRIIGRFRRRDVEEPLHSFQSVPRGTTLPAAFAFGGLSLRTPAPAVVASLPEPDDSELSAIGRKGIALSGDPCLTLAFPSPVARASLELAPGAELTWRAATTEFLTQLPQQTFGGVIQAERHVVIETAGPVDTLTFSGTGFLYGIREPAVAPTGSPDDLVTRSATLYGVVFAATPAPDAPASLDTAVLQQPSVPLPPGQPPPAPASIGFELTWQPPPPQGGVAVPWPANLNAYPPSDTLGFHLERRRVDTAGAYEPLDGAGTRTLVLGSRGSRPEPPPLVPGTDLDAVFPDVPVPIAPVAPEIVFDDVLISADHDGPPPGSLHQYRISSVDAIGRVSPTPREGAVVRLEKHQPPPQPVGPPVPPPGALPTAGVLARVLQSVDPSLGPGDQALLGSSNNVVVLEWGWTDVQRAADPLATEFRVYWQPLPPDIVTGTVTGPPVLAGGLLEMPASLDQPLAADAMTGTYVTLGDYPFRVASHTSGESIILVVEPSALDPSRLPSPGAFDHRPLLTGAQQRPPSWSERTAVVPLTDADSYRYVFRDRLVIDAEHPSSRVWVGVSCADDQSYVPDALPAAALNGGRPGNESAIAAATAITRYRWRPELTVPAPLPDVPEIVSNEPSGDTVAVAIDLPALLPAVTVPAGHEIVLERVSLDRIVACMSAQDDGTIGARFPDGSTASYTEANPGDQATLRAEIATGTPARVEGRFLVDFLTRFAPQLAPLWAPALPGPAPFGPLSDALPQKAERYVHRIRLSDPAGRVSDGAAIVPQIVRVPSLRSPAPPRLAAPSTDADALVVEARVLDAFDLVSVVVFAWVADAGTAADTNTREPAQLLRLPNRRDLYPLDGLRLRLADGTLLAPATAISTAGGVLEVPDRVLSATLTLGYTRRAALWAIALTRDGIPSRLAGPFVALTGEAPLVAPQLTVATASGVTTVTWTALAVPALLALERTLDGGVTWSQVSPWLDTGVTSYALPAAGGAAGYRPRLRASRGRTATGPEVTG